MCYSQETDFKGTNRLNIQVWKKIFHAKISQKNAAVSILISRISKNMTKDKEGHFFFPLW